MNNDTENPKPRCKDCFHFVEQGKKYGACELKPPLLTKQDDIEGEEWNQPMVTYMDGCSHHQDFENWKDIEIARRAGIK
jgi:hypothetical protein